jgi:SAM-dependent methyltransferase
MVDPAETIIVASTAPTVPSCEYPRSSATNDPVPIAPATPASAAVGVAFRIIAASNGRASGATIQRSNQPCRRASVALITVAQAWHWVDVPATSLEVARVLEPGGALALVWNIRDSEVDWVARLGEVMGASEAEKYDSQTPPVGAPLERQAYREFRWVTEMSREQFLAMVTSRSYVITMADAERDEMLARLGKLLDEHPDLAGRTSYPMPYVTRVTIARVAA